ncbi:MAG: CBS domain-containing protein [Gemmataceae bacterium]|nr:CBS domain-containing protein [Gemmataceae bacterium]
MLAVNVHRLFVVDKDGVPVGVISTLDIRHRLYK